MKSIKLAANYNNYAQGDFTWDFTFRACINYCLGYRARRKRTKEAKQTMMYRC